MSPGRWLATLVLLLCGCVPRARMDGLAPAPAHAALAALAQDRSDIRRQNAGARTDGGATTLSFLEGTGSFELPPEALGLPRDLRGYGQLVATIDNGAVPGGFELAAVGRHGQLTARRELGGGSSATLSVGLFDLPLATGGGSAFPIEFIRLRSWSATRAPRTAVIRSLTLVPSEVPALAPRVDRFGQRRNGSWTGKAESVDDLKTAAGDEQRALAQIPLPADRDEFGGWTAGPRWQEGDFFSVERDGEGRAWFVDPAGNAFWSLGVTSVQTRADATAVQGRESLFEALPDPESREGREVYLASDEGPALALYRWNVLRKWGDLHAWRDRTIERFRRWGLNTVGAYTTDPEMLVQRRVPHLRTVRLARGAPVPRSALGFPDVFDPRWAAHVDRLLAAEAGPARDNVWLIGYLIDDDLPWDRIDLLSTAPLRARWSAFLRGRYTSLTALNTAWGARLASWDEPSTAAAPDLAAFEAAYAQAYFDIIASALRRHDPNHLFLGCPLPPAPPRNAELARAAVAQVDVLALSFLDQAPDRARLDGWHALGEKPILVIAHHAPLSGPRQIEPHRPALDERARRAHYVRFVSTVAGAPYAVGAHWAQYVDLPLTGVAGRGANQIVGFVDITDRPHDDLVSAAREVLPRAYRMHAEAK